MAEDEHHQPTKDDELEHVFKIIQTHLPKETANIEEIMVIFPTRRENSMNTVLTQEMIRFNRLLHRILSTIVDLKDA